MLGAVAGRRRGLPITLREGSPAHRCYVVVPWVVAVAALVYVPFASKVGFAPGSIDKAFRIVQLNEVIAFAVAILGLNLVIGYSGQLSLGQSAFVGLGAYTSVILVADHGWSYFAALPVAAPCASPSGSHRRAGVADQGPYLAVGTLAMAYVFPELVVQLRVAHRRVERQGPGSREAELDPAVVAAVRRHRPPGPSRCGCTASSS